MTQARVSSRWNLLTGLSRLVFVLALLGGVVAGTLAETPLPAQRVGYQYYEIGDIHAQRPAAIEPGLMMVGGGEWPYEAFRWMAQKAGHGRIVILRASGSIEAQEEFFNEVGGITGAQTLVFQDREAASDPEVIEIVEKADGIFIAGGDQSRYVRYWKGTLLNDAINRHVREGKPLGGTSAGLAIMGAYSYGAMDGTSLTSATAMQDPLGPSVTLVNDFLQIPLLPPDRVITDSHFGKRDRLGRLLTFVARLSQEQLTAGITGIGIDENTALCIDGDHTGRVFTDTDGKAWLVVPQALVDLKESPRNYRRFMEKRVRRGEALDFPGFIVTGVGSGSRLLLPSFEVQNPAFLSKADVVQGQLIVSHLD